MTVELAQEVLEDVFPQGEPPEISIERIQETVSQRFGISHAGAHRRPALAADRLPAPGRDVPLPRAHRQLAAEDREEVRRPRPHHGHPRDVEDREADPGGPSVYNLVQELTARIKQAR